MEARPAEEKGDRIRRRLAVEGVVQGVGFRPFVHSLAVRWGLAGYVRNGSDGVRLEVEGPPSRVEAFQRELRSSHPPGASIHAVHAEAVRPRGEWGFRIEASRSDDPPRPALSPDLGTCPDCLRELDDPRDRRHRYPFLTCARCGPRFTIVREGPYDRVRTTLSGFPLCAECRREYEDPADGRFHAQAIACPDCGPRLWIEGDGGPEAGRRGEGDAVARAAAALAHGRVVAVKGLGGFHLACDARNREAIRRLRRRKGRDAKPFALMVPDLGAARDLCRVGPEEEELLRSARRPIVLLPRHPDAPVAPEVAPGLARLGLMLPYTPLHELLLAAVDGPLVLTSGNRSGETLVHDNEEARWRLAGVADLLLLHDRPIHVPCDDSVVLAGPGGAVPVRRSRGYVPEPIALPFEASRPVLALGGHLKNTFCLLHHQRVITSQHVGDLDDLSAVESLTRTLAHLSALVAVEPRVIAHDLHPDYRTTRLAHAMARELEGVEPVGVQHHLAHAAACLAEHACLEEDAIGVVLDGAGFGLDGAVWGGEFLVVGPEGCRRWGHLAYRLLPGGEAAVKEPWRMAAVHREAAVGPGWEREAGLSPGGVAPERRRAVLGMIRRGTGGPVTSSAGRLFDAASALLGVKATAAYEGEAAMALESMSDPSVERSYPVALSPDPSGGADWVWDPAPLVRGILADLGRSVPLPEIGGAFHNAVRDAVLAGCVRIREETGAHRVALTGGVFQNALLLEKTVAGLRAWGFTPLVHRQVPPNDGGLALGQAVVAARGVRWADDPVGGG